LEEDAAWYNQYITGAGVRVSPLLTRWSRLFLSDQLSASCGRREKISLLERGISKEPIFRGCLMVGQDEKLTAECY